MYSLRSYFRTQYLSNCIETKIEYYNRIEFHLVTILLLQFVDRISFYSDTFHYALNSLRTCVDIPPCSSPCEIPSGNGEISPHESEDGVAKKKLSFSKKN